MHVETTNSDDDVQVRIFVAMSRKEYQALQDHVKLLGSLSERDWNKLRKAEGLEDDNSGNYLVYQILMELAHQA